jgi:predicted DCC family thiol-disulfide oxidoreductase YuxK
MTVPVVQFTIAGETAADGLGRPYTVVYDGTCKVCTRLANVLRRWDKPLCIEVVASQTPGVPARFPWIPAKAYAEALQMIGPGGRTWSGAAAVEQILKVLPKGKLIAWIFSIPFMRAIADRFYRWFARNRYHLGCGDHCQSRPMDVLFREGEEAERAAPPTTR